MVRKDIAGMQSGGVSVGQKTTEIVTKLDFPEKSRTPQQIGCPCEGRPDWKGPRLGFSYATGCEDTNLYAAARTASPARCAASTFHSHPFASTLTHNHSRMCEYAG